MSFGILHVERFEWCAVWQEGDMDASTESICGEPPWSHGTVSGGSDNRPVGRKELRIMLFFIIHFF